MVDEKGMDYFEVFGLPRRLMVDETALQRNFYELSRRYHPDFHQGASPEEQAQILKTSARVNAAYRALRDPIRRIEYLVRLLEGREIEDAGAARPKPPAGLLAEMFEIQEALQEAQAGGLDATGRAALQERREQLEIRYRAEEGRLRGPLSEAWDISAPGERPRALAALKETLATRTYLRTVIDDLTQVLDEGRQTHVAHHRH
jgi:molecular chaperone HscB